MTAQHPDVVAAGNAFEFVRPKVTERLVLPASATGGALTIMEVIVRPGGLVAPVHVHQNEDESVFVLDGTLGARLGAEELSMAAGSALFGRRGVEHTYWNAGDTTVRMVMVVTPGNLDDYFQRLPGLISSVAGPELGERIAEHAAGFELQLQLDSVPELIGKYRLTPP